MPVLKKLVPGVVKRQARERVQRMFNFPPPEAIVGFSQEGEDTILNRVLDLPSERAAGFYVDVGAHHPLQYSNTYSFYCRGWRGINIDPLPGSMELFRAVRPRDVNLELAISDSRAPLTYYQFNTPLINGFDRELAMSRDGHYGCKLIGTKEVQARPLVEVLDEHLPAGQPIDFMSVDVEGHDLNVLQSNDWTKYRPSVVLAEDANVMLLDEVAGSPVAQFMVGQGYVAFAKAALTLFFAERSRIERGKLGLRVKLQGSRA